VSVLILGAGAVLIIVEWLLLGRGIWMYSALPLVALVATSWPVEIYAYARAERQMARMAREIQLRREVMTSVIHDLKQPLFAIQMSAQTLLRRAQSAMDTGSAERLLQIIERQTKRLTQQINTLLEADPSRPVRPAVRPVDLGQLVRDQVELNRGMATDGHTVAYEGPDGEVIATADPDLVGRAVANLLGNAIKYSPDGGAVTVSMNVARGSVRISVADQGLGIPAAHQQQVLEPFSRAHPERADIEGTGLGLFSVRRIAESHDGELTFVSREGAGSTFTLRLPLSGPVSVEQE
jgi:signal transduction histidine kinase